MRLEDRQWVTKLIERKDSINQLQTNKSSIKDLFNDLLNEAKGFQYKITRKNFAKKYERNGDIEFVPVYLNSTTKTVLNQSRIFFSRNFVQDW